VARLLQDSSARPVKVGVRGRLAGGGDFAEAHERRPGPAVTSATTWLATTAALVVQPYVAREKSRVATRNMAGAEPRLEGDVPGGEKAVYTRHRGETRGEERGGRRSSRAAAA